LAAALTPAWAPLSTLLDAPVVAGLVLVVVVEVVAAGALLAVEAVPAAFALEVVVDDALAPGTSPSWLSALKMLSMNPIMPPPRSESSPSW